MHGFLAIGRLIESDKDTVIQCCAFCGRADLSGYKTSYVCFKPAMISFAACEECGPKYSNLDHEECNKLIVPLMVQVRDQIQGMFIPEENDEPEPIEAERGTSAAELSDEADPVGC